MDLQPIYVGCPITARLFTKVPELCITTLCRDHLTLDSQKFPPPLVGVIHLHSLAMGLVFSESDGHTVSSSDCVSFSPSVHLISDSAANRRPHLFLVLSYEGQEACVSTATLLVSVAEKTCPVAHLICLENTMPLLRIPSSTDRVWYCSLK